MTISDAVTRAVMTADRAVNEAWETHFEQAGVSLPFDIGWWDVEYEKAIQVIIADELQGARHGR